MTIITSICRKTFRYRNYESMVESLQHTATLHGYRLIVNDLDEKDYLLNRIIKATEQFAELDDHVMISDADVLVLRPIDTLFEQDFAVGLSYRADWPTEQGRNDINCGVVLLNNNRKADAISFMNKWIDKTKEIHKDEIWWYEQQALNEVAPIPTNPRSLEGYMMGNDFNTEIHDGIALLDGWKYCCPLSVVQSHKSSIIHYNFCVLHTKGLRVA